jgi:hypothetical protein
MTARADAVRHRRDGSAFARSIIAGELALTDWQPIDILPTKTSNETRYVREKKMPKAFAAVTAMFIFTVRLATAAMAGNDR